ncbi:MULTISPECIES: GntR family transcriptional regulator [Mediterraneibacter]|jgi:DNA-binding GntR family transcriptional regulator|uniref:GntR family transcriptional regulator n=1 Tax=Mediterraneibacter TaxID=2316020 RepID=UPI000E4B2CBB|nr:GntR family transcriptional regulator [Mediterraneibacter massiliensis]RGT72407.1 GntR family transcriptional regulator [Ruminococcus sp. AF18-22]
MELCAENRLTDLLDFNPGMNDNNSAQPLHQMVYHILRYAIISGRVLPGEHLKEYMLSKTLRVSRTPVRAAIIRLENEGLVMRRNGRTIVQDFLGREMAEVIAIRKSLERLAVVTACRSVKESDILRLKEINAEFGNALCVGNISKGAHADERFHEEIFRIADNPVLLRMLYGLEKSAYGYRTRACSAGANAKSQTVEHGRIIEALQKRDSQLAEQAAMLHIEGQRYALFDRVRKGA